MTSAVQCIGDSGVADGFVPCQVVGSVLFIRVLSGGLPRPSRIAATYRAKSVGNKCPTVVYLLWVGVGRSKLLISSPWTWPESDNGDDDADLIAEPGRRLDPLHNPLIVKYLQKKKKKWSQGDPG